MQNIITAYPDIRKQWDEQKRKSELLQVEVSAKTYTLEQSIEERRRDVLMQFGILWFLFKFGCRPLADARELHLRSTADEFKKSPPILSHRDNL